MCVTRRRPAQRISPPPALRPFGNPVLSTVRSFDRTNGVKGLRATPSDAEGRYSSGRADLIVAAQLLTRLVDLPHAAGAQQANDLVRTEPITGGQAQGFTSQGWRPAPRCCTPPNPESGLPDQRPGKCRAGVGAESNEPPALHACITCRPATPNLGVSTT